MGLESFDLPCGSAADVAELEYISALHQTGENVRLDGSVKACDIRLYLASRYGITITEEQVKDIVLHGLGADVNDVLDLPEVVACLLMPTLLKAKNQQAGNPLPHFVVEADPDLVEKVLKTIQRDVLGGIAGTGYDGPLDLSVDMIQQILRTYGEHELADNQDLMKEMVEACYGGPGQPKRDRLDKMSFAAGLTCDIELLDLANEGSLTTNLADVLRTRGGEAGGGNSFALERALDENPSVLMNFHAKNTRQEKTYSHIDTTAGNMRSKSLIVLLWATFVVSYFTFRIDAFETGLEDICWPQDVDNYTVNAEWGENLDSIACASGVSIVMWLFYFISLAVLGLLYITGGSTGNSVFCKDWRKPLLGATVVLLPIVILFLLQRKELQRKEEKKTKPFLSASSLALAFVTALHHLCHSMYLALPCFRRLADQRHWLLASSLYAEMRLKRSAAKKLNTLVANALALFEKANQDKIDTVDDSSSQYSRVLQAYAKHGKVAKPVGGVIWAWKRLLGLEEGSIKDGIWISTRLLASNVSQYIVAFFLLVEGSSLIKTVNDDFSREYVTAAARNFSTDLLSGEIDMALMNDSVGNVTSFVRTILASQESSGIDFGCADFSTSAEDVLAQYCSSTNNNEPPFNMVCDQNADINYICPFLQEENLAQSEQLALLVGSGISDGTVMQSLLSVVDRATVDVIEAIYPTREYMLAVPLAVGTVLAFLTAFYLAFSYIPSVMYTTLKLRTGVIPTLRDPRFFKFRTAPDLVASLTGAIFWGTIGSAFIVGGVIGFVVFVFMWQASRFFAQHLVTVVVGFTGVTVIRTLFLLGRRKRYFRSWYRERPGPANVLLLALEWAYFSLAAGFIVVRMIKLLLCAAFNVGRIDTPFLAPGVGRVGNIELDNYHMVHLQDVLAHEADRHPYIELLGVIYMMKLRHGGQFGNRAGSCWRLIFVHALLPWLQTFRIMARPEKVGGGRINEMSAVQWHYEQTVIRS